LNTSLQPFNVLDEAVLFPGVAALDRINSTLP
jgi:hypothetical protein